MYSQQQGRKSLREALGRTYTLFLGWEVNPDTEVVVSTGANEGWASIVLNGILLMAKAGILSAITAFISPGDEVLVFEPFYDQ